MNKIYRVVFNEAVGVWQAVAEVGAARGKSSGKSAVQSVVLALGLMLAGGASADGGDGGRASIYPLAPGGKGGTSASPVGSDGIGWTSNPGGAQYPGQGSGGGGGAMYVSGTGAGNGGRGGNGGNGGAGGTAGARNGNILTSQSVVSGNNSGGAGGNGADAPAKASGSGEAGGGGGGGGGGGAAVVSSASDLSVMSGGQLTGGVGGNGGRAGQLMSGGWGNSAGGGGGQGGAALLITATDMGKLSNDSVVTGGNGGAGGDGSLNAEQGGSYGGSGGDGGTAVLFSNASSGSVVNGGTMAGGHGGARGEDTAGSAGARAGNGGAGLNGNNLRIINTGTIRGGVGGSGRIRHDTYITSGQGGGGIAGNALMINNSGTISGGNGGVILGGGTPVGNGGVAITGADLNVTNSGTIKGGEGVNGTTRAEAIVFTAGNNTLQINAGSDIQGNVIGATGGGAHNSLNLGGTGTSSFAVSEIGTKYQNFGSFGKVDASTWTLSGSTTSLTPWTVSAGTLAISSDASLGAESGGLTLDGGTLQTTANLSMSRHVVIDSAGGTLDTKAATTLDLSSVISGGALVKAGAGTLTLSGNNSYAGGTTLRDGILSVASDVNLGAASSTLTLDGGRLQSTATFSVLRAVAAGVDGGSFNPSAGTTLTLRGVLSGTGVLTQAGAGTLVLASDSSAYTGLLQVKAGTLAVNGSIGSNVQVYDGSTLSGVGRIKGSVDVASGGILSPGNSPGTLAIGGDLALGSGTTSIFQLGQSGAVGGVSNDLVTVGGDLVLGGTLQADASSAGWYRLFEYAGTLSGKFDTEQISSTGGSFTVVSHQLDTSQQGQINLSVHGAGQTLQFWRDGTGGVWSGFTDAWVNDVPMSTAPDVWLGSVAVFGSDTGATPGSVTVQGGQRFDTLQFSADGYHLVADNGGATPGRLVIAPASGTQATINTDAGISAGISASIVDGVGNALLKVGSGTLMLSGANTYSGGTQVNEGLLVAGSHGALGSGAVTVDNGADLGATLQVASGMTLINTITLNNGATLDNAGTLAAAGTPVGATTGAATVLNRMGAIIQGDVALNATGENVVRLFNGSQILGDLNIGSNTAASLTLDGDGTQVYSQAVRGTTIFAGALTKTGAGTWEVDQVLTPASVAINAGTLALIGSGDLGASPLLMTASGASLDISGANGSRSVDSFSGVADSTLILGANHFSFGDASDQSFIGSIVGAGGITKQGSGVQTLAGPNTYSGGTTLSAGTLAVANNSALGTGGLDMAADTVLAFAANNLTLANPIVMSAVGDHNINTGSGTATLTGGISGAGALIKTGRGRLILGVDNNSYTGTTTIAQGTLQVGAVNALSVVSSTTVSDGATLDLAGYNQTLSSLHNAGIVKLGSNSGGAAPGAVLTVTGAYVGNNGNLGLSTVLGADGSATDKLLLSGAGAVASGHTTIHITNAGGLGEQTTDDGIEVVGTEHGASLKPGSFTLAGGHVDAGAYEYRLRQTEQGAALHSTNTTPTTTAYRAEVPLLSALPAQLRQADMAMLGDLRRRMGDGGIHAATSPDAGANHGVWGRILRTDPKSSQQGTVSPESSGHLTGFQAGVDLYADHSVNAGIYVGQLEGDMDVKGFSSGLERKDVGFNKLRIRYLGMYATWQDASGLYADAVLQGAHYRSDLRTAGNTAQARTKGNGWLASLEMGKAFELNSQWQIEPQVQIIYHKLSIDDTTLSLATVKNQADDDWTVRLGARIKGDFSTAAGVLQPYARINVYKASNTTDIASFTAPSGATDIKAKGGYTSTEMAVGVSLQISPRASVYGELGKLWANSGDNRVKSGVQTSLGVKVEW